MEKIIICFLTVRPNNIFYDLVRELPNQDNIYICIDDDNHEISNYDNKIKIIKVDKTICEKNGYKNTHSKIVGATSREKALYYFNKIEKNYNKIWFIEEDVLISSIDTIVNIDKKYPNGDLLVKSNSVFNEKVRDGWHWNKIHEQIKLDPPYGISMICAIRCSRKLMIYIDEYAKKNNELIMCEVMFNTLAIQNKLEIISVKELNIICKEDCPNGWAECDIKNGNMYHPVKDMNLHKKYRCNNK